MRILFLTHGFNSLTQRLFTELASLGHELSIEFDIADSVSEEAVALFQPDLVLAPFLKRRISESIWRRYVCMVVHPGIVGDRGPSALDWAIQNDELEWGVTVLQAEAEMDAGPVWATAAFPMRSARKSSLYRREVAEAAVVAVKDALSRLARGEQPVSLMQHRAARGCLRPSMRQADRAIDWERDTTADIVRRINAADGFPGVADKLFGQPCHLYDACPDGLLLGQPGAVIARRETALCRATVDGAVWIGHVRRVAGTDFPFKLPATIAFATESAGVPKAMLAGWHAADHATWQDIRYEEVDAVGFLHFDFYNGAMGTQQCRRLAAAFQWAAARPTRVIMLMGGEDFWSNGIHLNLIEAARSPAEESWENINAIDDLAEAILRCDSHLTVAALAANAGAGGCFLARACDEVWVRDGVILNPHYKNMGNLYGSEFWSYLLPARVGSEGAAAIMRHRLPMSAGASVQLGFYDEVLAGDALAFRRAVAARAAGLAADHVVARVTEKRMRRLRDEAAKPLAAWREEELRHMRQNFFGFDPSYHVARWHFVNKSPQSWTPRHLARHRELPNP